MVGADAALIQFPQQPVKAVFQLGRSVGVGLEMQVLLDILLL